jgi:hypothetical protein
VRGCSRRGRAAQVTATAAALAVVVR